MSASFQTDSNFWTKKNVQISSFEVNVKDRIGATKFRPKCDYFTPEKRTDLRKQTNVWNLSFLVIKCMEATSNLREANQDKSGTKMPNTIILSPEMEQMETLKLPFQCMRSIFQTFQTNPGIVPCRFLFLRTHIDCFYIQTGGRSSTVIHHLMQTQSEIHWYLLTFNHSSWPLWMPGRALKIYPGIPPIGCPWKNDSPRNPAFHLSGMKTFNRFPDPLKTRHVCGHVQPV